MFTSVTGRLTSVSLFFGRTLNTRRPQTHSEMMLKVTEQISRCQQLDKVSSSQEVVQQLWKTLLLLHNQSGGDRRSHELARCLDASMMTTHLDHFTLPAAVAHLTLKDFSDDEACVLKEFRQVLGALKEKAFELDNRLIGEERRRFRLDMGLAYAALAASFPQTAESKLADSWGTSMAAKLADVSRSRAFFRSVTPTQLARLACLLTSRRQLNEDFHKYYFLYKVYELADEVPLKDFSLIFIVMSQHSMVLPNDPHHPLTQKFFDKIMSKLSRELDQIKNEDLTMGLKAVQVVCSYFLSFRTHGIFAKGELDSLEQNLLGLNLDDIDPDLRLSLLVSVGALAWRSAANGLNPAFIDIMRTALDCSHLLIKRADGLIPAVDLLSSRCLPQELKACLVTVLERSLLSLLKFEAIQLYVAIRCITAMHFLGFYNPDLLAQIISHPKLTRKSGEGYVLRNDISKSVYNVRRRSMAKMLKYLSGLATIRYTQYSGPKLLLEPNQPVFNEEREGDFLSFCQFVVAEIVPQEAKVISVVPEFETIDFLLTGSSENNSPRLHSLALVDARGSLGVTCGDPNLFMKAVMEAYDAREVVPHVLDVRKIFKESEGSLQLHRDKLIKMTEAALRQVVQN